MQRTEFCVHVTSQGDEAGLCSCSLVSDYRDKVIQEDHMGGFPAGATREAHGCGEAAQITAQHRASECVGLAAGAVAPQSEGGWKRNCHCAPRHARWDP